MSTRSMRNNQRAKLLKATEPTHVAGFAGTALRNAILGACDRFEANEEFKRQHGPVKILFKDGKPVYP